MSGEVAAQNYYMVMPNLRESILTKPMDSGIFFGYSVVSEIERVSRFDDLEEAVDLFIRREGDGESEKGYG